MMRNWTLFVTATLLAFSAPAMADWMVDVVSVDSSASAAVVNPISNTVYFLAGVGGGVIVLDGVTHQTTMVPDARTFLIDIAANPLADKVYYVLGVPIGMPGAVVEIDGRTLDTAEITTGVPFGRLSVNALTNKLYGQSSVGWLYEVDGATRDTARFGLDTADMVSAVNAATNRVCVVHRNALRMTILDPTNGDTVQAPTGASRNITVAVNPATNRAYVSDADGDNVTVIDCASLDTTLVPAVDNPYRPGINPATNRVYVGNDGDYVTVIDGATGDTALVKVEGAHAIATLCVDPVANEVYARYWGGFVAVIDGVTNRVTLVPGDTVSVGFDLAVNPITGRYYAPGRGCVYVFENADYVVDTVPGWFSLYDVATDPVRGRAWVANWALGALTMIDGATLDTTIVRVRPEPERVVVDPVANRVYALGSQVTIVDGASFDTTGVQVQHHVREGAVNVATGKVFLTHESVDLVTVLDGATLEMDLVPAGDGPKALAVNPATNRAYVANYWGKSVTVIDGATLDTALVTVGDKPFGVAVNPVTNRIYVTDYEGASVTEIDGADNGTTPIAAGAGASWVAVNPVTNQVFVVNYLDGTVTVVDGASRETRTVRVGQEPKEVVVDPVRDKAYVACYASGEVWVIDGATCAATTFAAGTGTRDLAVDPVTGRLHFLNNVYSSYVVTPARVADTKLHSYLDSPVACTTGYARPQLSGNAVNRWTPYQTPVQAILTRVGTSRQEWNMAAPVGSPGDSVRWFWQWGDDTLAMGENFLCCVPVEANVATSHTTGAGSPFVGNLEVYPMYRTSLSAGVADELRPRTVARPAPTFVRGVLVLGAADRRQNAGYRAELLDISGRKVTKLVPGANDVSGLPPGVYFVQERSAVGVRKVIISK